MLAFIDVPLYLHVLDEESGNGAVEGRNVFGTDRLVVVARTPEMRRSEQSDRRHAREVRADEGSGSGYPPPDR